MAPEVSIPLDKAFELCKAHRTKNGARMFSQCWGCVRYSKESPEKMCFYKPPDNNACRHVNKLFEEANKK